MFIRYLITCFFLVELQTISAKTDMEVKAFFFRLGLECNKDHHISPEEMVTLHHHKMPDSKEAKCLIACVFKKANLINNKGVFDTEAANSLAASDYAGDDAKIENAKKLTESCKNVNDATVTDGEEGCDRAGLLFSCFVENSPKFGFPLI